MAGPQAVSSCLCILSAWPCVLCLWTLSLSAFLSNTRKHFLLFNPIQFPFFGSDLWLGGWGGRWGWGRVGATDNLQASCMSPCQFAAS